MNIKTIQKNKLQRGISWWIACFLLFMLAGTISAQDARLQLLNQEILCSGYTENSNALLTIDPDTPFRVPAEAGAGIVYDWYAKHERATKFWNTPLETRKIPLPWPGEYQVYAIVRYVNKASLSTYYSYRSKVLTINVENCPEAKTSFGKKITPGGSPRKN